MVSRPNRTDRDARRGPPVARLNKDRREAARAAWREVAKASKPQRRRLRVRVSIPWWILGVVGVVGGLWWLRPETPLQRPIDEATIVAVAGESDGALGGGDAKRGGDPKADDTPSGTGGGLAEVGSDGSSNPATTADSAEPAEPPTREQLARKVPAGTIPANAKAFARIPVSPKDGPPLGGIGAHGIHVDSIELGAPPACEPRQKRVSVAEHGKLTVCFRVVHPRRPQRVTVLWQRGGATRRRTFVNINAAHAYRSRANLVLRPEHAGPWKVHVVSEDDVDLASTNFDVVP